LPATFAMFSMSFLKPNKNRFKPDGPNL
jgi:hypothetical protein